VWSGAEWAAWQPGTLQRGPVGPASRWSTTSNVEVGQTTYTAKRGKGRVGGERRERGTKSQRGEERRE